MKSIRPFLAALMLSVSGLSATAQDEPPAAVEAAPAAEVDAAPETEGATAVPTAPSDLSGWWTGTWLSHSNGHDGPIRGYFSKISDDQYRVHFDGRFWGVFPFKYSVILTVTERNSDSLTMSGSSDLGLLFGTFRYTATVTDTHFVASYCSRRDQGVFSLSRACQCR